MTRSLRYQPILHTLYYTLHTEHAYCLSYRFLNNAVITTIIEMVEMVEILDGRLGKHSVERVRYVIKILLHLVIVKYGDISLVLCTSTHLRLVTILSLLVKYLIILHADPCNKSYIYIYGLQQRSLKGGCTPEVLTPPLMPTSNYSYFMGKNNSYSNISNSVLLSGA